MSSASPASPSSASGGPHASIIQHMNDDHADSLLHYARYYGRLSTATRATMISLDLFGFSLSATYGELGGSEDSHITEIRIPFKNTLNSPSEFRPTLVAMAKEAAAGLVESDGLPANPREAKERSAEKARKISQAAQPEGKSNNNKTTSMTFGAPQAAYLVTALLVVGGVIFYRFKGLRA